MGIRELLRDYKGLDVIPLYVVENPGPIIAVDALGNIIEDNAPMPQLTYEWDTELMDAEGVSEGIGLNEGVCENEEGDGEGPDLGVDGGEGPDIEVGDVSNPDILIPMVQKMSPQVSIPKKYMHKDLKLDPHMCPENPHRMPAYRPPRPQNVPQPSNVQSSTISSQNKVHQKASRKQKAPISLSSKLEKRKVAPSENAFKRQCCPPTKPSISSVLRGVENSYQPRTQPSGSSSTGHSTKD
ncbi:hypothetical protein Salat_1041500 [Sesamum alatum]|uniref:Uncharacterized protein n=1 Tax=Sesamum alatum TaxID=300844 RepID=A0AAE1YNB5_9LAMI|nr:hypothetical protein Salat_1041500 [Sesamum alatum]